MSRPAERYEGGGWLRVRVSEPHLRRAEVRLARQGVSGLAVIGRMVRAMVRREGGYRKRGRGRSLMVERGLADRRRSKGR